MAVDVTDILQTSKHNFQSKAKHENMSNLVKKRKNICPTLKNYFVLFAN